MSEDRIQRKDLWNQLGNIKKLKIWIKAAETLGLIVTQPKGGSSHYAVRLPDYERSDVRGVITTVYDSMRRDHNEKVFKALLNKGFKEDDIWRALEMLGPEQINE